MTSQGPQSDRTRDDEAEAGFFGCQMDLEAFAGYPEYDDLLDLLRSYGENFAGKGITRISPSYEVDRSIFEDENARGVLFITPTGFNRTDVERALYEGYQFPRKSKSNGVHHQPAWLAEFSAEEHRARWAPNTEYMAHLDERAALLASERQAAVAEHEKAMAEWRRTVVIPAVGQRLVTQEHYAHIAFERINDAVTACTFRSMQTPTISFIIRMGQGANPNITIVRKDWDGTKWVPSGKIFENTLDAIGTLQAVI
ncbi:MAG: hypothetical protein AAB588_06650 [Patescibacteria group bacterium]